MYDISMRSPLLIKWPGHIQPGIQTNAMVQNIDYTPTFLDITGNPVPESMQEMSFKNVLQHPKTELPGKSLYYHFYEFHSDHRVLQHIGVRTDRYKLMYFYTVDEWQLYDLKKDPAGLTNLANDPAQQAVLAEMKKELIRQRKHYDDHEPAVVLH